MLKYLKNHINYYFWATYRRKILDKLLEENKHYYKGVVLDIGGRDRGGFSKPKNRVDKWIFADIESKHNPDIVLDVCDMNAIKSESIDVVNAIELFEHVENTEKGLRECYRVLKKNGVMVLSAPFLFPIHADPYDFQRWTAEKWKRELKKAGFEILKFEIMGSFFTVLADMIKTFIKSIPGIIMLILYIFFPLLDLLTRLDKLIKNHPKLGKFHGGYFMVLRR